MTLVVGILCDDGVVIGSDSAVTFGYGVSFTIEQLSKRKVELISDRAILAFSGSIGIGQRIKRAVEGNMRYNGKEPIEFGCHISQTAYKDFLGTGLDLKQGEFGALLAYIDRSDKAHLIEFAGPRVQPEIRDDASWYISMGSGQGVVDPILGLVRKAFWGDTPPPISEGVFYLVLALELGFEMAPFGVSGPCQVAVIKRNASGKLHSVRLSEEEIDQHRENYKDAIKYFGEYRNRLQNDDQGFPTLKSSST